MAYYSKMGDDLLKAQIEMSTSASSEATDVARDEQPLTAQERLINMIATRIIEPASTAPAPSGMNTSAANSASALYRSSIHLHRRSSLQASLDSLRLMLFASRLNAAGFSIAVSTLLQCATLDDVYASIRVENPETVEKQLVQEGLVNDGAEKTTAGREAGQPEGDAEDMNNTGHEVHFAPRNKTGDAKMKKQISSLVTVQRDSESAAPSSAAPSRPTSPPCSSSQRPAMNEQNPLEQTPVARREPPSSCSTSSNRVASSSTGFPYPPRAKCVDTQSGKRVLDEDRARRSAMTGELVSDPDYPGDLLFEHRRLYRTAESESFHRIDVTFTLLREDAWDIEAVHCAVLHLIKRHVGLRLSFYDPGDFLNYMQSAASHAMQMNSTWLSRLLYIGWPRCCVAAAGHQHEQFGGGATALLADLDAQFSRYFQIIDFRASQERQRSIQSERTSSDAPVAASAVANKGAIRSAPTADVPGAEETESAGDPDYRDLPSYLRDSYHDVLPQVRAVLSTRRQRLSATADQRRHVLKLHFTHGVADGGSGNPLLKDFVHFYDSFSSTIRPPARTTSNTKTRSVFSSSGSSSEDQINTSASTFLGSSSRRMESVTTDKNNPTGLTALVLDPRIRAKRFFDKLQQQLVHGIGKPTEKNENPETVTSSPHGQDATAADRRGPIQVLEDKNDPTNGQGPDRADRSEEDGGPVRARKSVLPHSTLTTTTSSESLSTLKTNAMLECDQRLYESLVNRSRTAGPDLMPFWESVKRREDYEYFLEFSPVSFLPYLARKHGVTLDNVILGLFGVTSYRFLLLSPTFYPYFTRFPCNDKHSTFSMQVVAPLRDQLDTVNLVANLVSYRTIRANFLASATVQDCFKILCEKVKNREWEVQNCFERTVFLNLRSSVGKVSDHVSQEFQYPRVREQPRRGSMHPSEYPIRLMVDQLSDNHDYVAWIRSWEHLHPGSCNGELFHDLLEDTLWCLIDSKPEEHCVRFGLSEWQKQHGIVGTRERKYNYRAFPYRGTGDRIARLCGYSAGEEEEKT
ncbi:unnamed protein product [Amoebophrya sp. A120]|nr:unnamed protein product [Amoebophrya sp. A120]|eukprot:GSA120T00011168001.1